MRKYLGLLAAIILTFTPLLGMVVSSPKANAVSAGDWQAGRIIDDGIFTFSASMDVGQIQAFLNSHVGTGATGKTPGQCDTAGTATSEYGGGTRADYGAAHNNPAPFTCLKDYYEVPKTAPGAGLPVSNYGGAAIPAGAESAAQLIWDAAQAYSISPKVLLVMIQKESPGPLITDDWPFKSQYTYALGAHCPDGPNGATCDPNYAGFSLQIRESAKLLRSYLDGMDQPWWGCTDSSGAKIQCPANQANGTDPGGSYKVPNTNNFILWNSNRTCGGNTIFIRNKATAALYYYTPYQPNQAALNNMYGSGDGCSAYGNRNFWRIYNDWFGSSIGCPPVDSTYIYRLFRKGDGDYLYTSNPSEICQAVQYYNYIIEGPIGNNDVNATDTGARSLFRLSRNGLHLFTTDPNEVNIAMQTYGYTYEGVSFYVSSVPTNRYPIYRLSKNSHYMFTASLYEKNAYQSSGFSYEGNPFYLTSTSQKIPIYRISKNGLHLYTSSDAEKNAAVLLLGYNDEGIAFYGLSGQTGDNMLVYRLQRSKRYLNTVFPDEKATAVQIGYAQETSYFFAYPPNYPGTVPVYRLSNPANGDYLLTTNAAERDSALNYGYHLEGVGFDGAP